MIRRFAFAAAFAAAFISLPAIAAAQAKPAPSQKADSAKPAMSHEGHGAMKMDHAAMDHGAMAGGHDMASCPMCQVHMKMMAFYKAIMADSVIHARIRDTKALHDQHHEIDELLEKMPAHGEGGMQMSGAAEGGMSCPMMKKDKPTG